MFSNLIHMYEYIDQIPPQLLFLFRGDKSKTKVSEVLQ